jgi:CheY-like chemotaxis protein
MQGKSREELNKFLWGTKQNKAKMLKLVERSADTLEKARALVEEDIKLDQRDKKIGAQELRHITGELENLVSIKKILESEENPWPEPKETKVTLKKSTKKTDALSLQPKKILIIEDESIIVKSTAYFLAQENYSVSYALRAEMGLKKVRTEKPDLILLDIMMPGMDGYQFLNAVKQEKETRDIPVIILSSLSRESDILEGLERGAADYITKPFSPPVLISKIKKIME